MHDALKTMYNAERKGKKQVLIRPSSKVVIKFLQVMMKHGASCYEAAGPRKIISQGSRLWDVMHCECPVSLLAGRRPLGTAYSFLEYVFKHAEFDSLCLRPF